MQSNEIRSCEDALRLLAAHLDGELDSATDSEVERHLARCRSCYSRAEFERRLKASVAALAHEPVRSELSDRIQAVIRRFTVADGESPAPR